MCHLQWYPIHVYFPIDEITNKDEYKELKVNIADSFPFFDRGALDSARFIFGVKNPTIIINDGDKLITEYLDDVIVTML